MARLAAVVILCLTACQAPPYESTPEEKRRPDPEDPRRYSGVIVDDRMESTRLKDIVLRGAARPLEDDEWRFFEVTVEGEEEPRALPFAALRRVMVKGLSEGKLVVQLVPWDGAIIEGRLNRRSAIEGESALGQARVKLRSIMSLSFDKPREP